MPDVLPDALTDSLDQLEVVPGSALLTDISRWLQDTVLQPATLLQTVIAVGILACGWLLARLAKRWLGRFEHSATQPLWQRLLLGAVRVILFPLMTLLLITLYTVAARLIGLGTGITGALASLMTAMVVIYLAAFFLGKGYQVVWVKAVALTAVALNVFGVLDDTVALLKDKAIVFGDVNLSLFALLKGITVFIIFMWVAGGIARAADRTMNKSSKLTPTLRLLLGKLVKISLYVMAALIGLNSIGVDLTTFAVFSGAVGVGVGFGLQKGVSNFISGISLLLDRSIKPGDVIAVGDTYGWVNALSTRYVSVVTRDGKEHLIPNELLISERVENWSFTDSNIRLRVPFGVSYDADPKTVRDVALKAVEGLPRALKTPKPVCLMTGYGDSSVDYELRIWINDPANGIGNMKSEVLFSLWYALKEQSIEIPFPQRDLHLRSADGQAASVFAAAVQSGGSGVPMPQEAG